jgi:hypothetical protein
MCNISRSGMGIIGSMVNMNRGIKEMRDMDKMQEVFYTLRISLVGLVPRDVERCGM